MLDIVIAIVGILVTIVIGILQLIPDIKRGWFKKTKSPKK